MALYFLQGQTVPLPNVLVVDIRSAWKPGMAYVMLSRVCEPSQLVIMEELAEENITVHRDVIKECKRMDRISLNANPDRWNNLNIEGLRVSSLNARSLRKHFVDIQQDPVLQKSDVICIQESWLEEHESEDDRYLPEGFKGFFCCQGRGKGLAIFVRDEVYNKDYNASSFASPTLQLLKLTLPTIDIINVYRSKCEPLDQLRRHIESVFVPVRPLLVVGDFNFCFKKERNCLSEWLDGLGFNQLVPRATHICGGLLDQAYLYTPEASRNMAVEVAQYDNYFSDHDTIALILPAELRPSE